MTSKEALELLELILNNHSIMLEVDDNRMECLNVIKERLEVLENFISKNLVLLKQFDNSHYAKLIDNIVELTDEEYELLKEVLSNELV